MSTGPGRLAVLTESVKIVLLDCDEPICNIFGARTAAWVATDLRGLLVGQDVELPEDIVRENPLSVLRATVRLAPQLAGDVEAALHVAEIAAAAGAETTLGAFDVVRACIDTGRLLAVVSDTGAQSREGVHGWAVAWVEGDRAHGRAPDLMVSNGLLYLHGLDLLTRDADGLRRYLFDDAEVVARYEAWLVRCVEYDNDPEGWSRQQMEQAREAIAVERREQGR